MDKEITELLNNKKVLYSLIILCSFFLIVTCADFYNSLQTDEMDFKVDIENPSDKYYGMVKLGLAPSTYSREPTPRDIDTGIKFRDGDNLYSLVESRTWDTLDYGKTFVVQIN